MVTKADYTWSEYSPVDNTGRQRSIFRSAYKNVRFSLTIQRNHTVTNTDIANFPGLSYKFYGTTDLWRILLSFNGLSDPLNDLYVGQVLRVPTKDSIIAYLSRQQNNALPVRRI